MMSSPSRNAVSGVCSAGFKHARATGRERRRELPRGHHERKVPRDDLRDDADGLAARERVDATAFRPPIEDLDRRAFDLRGPSGHVAKMVDRAGHVDDARHELRLAVVEALELRELVGVLVDEISETPDQRLALRRATSLAHGPRLERLACGGDGLVDVGARSRRRSIATRRPSRGRSRECARSTRIAPTRRQSESRAGRRRKDATPAEGAGWAAIATLMRFPAPLRRSDVHGRAKSRSATVVVGSIPRRDHSECRTRRSHAASETRRRVGSAVLSLFKRGA